MKKTFKQLIAGTAFFAFSSLSMAANPVSVHVLNLQNGLPSPGMEVTLEKQDKQNWNKLNTGKTDDNGRITGLYPDGKALEPGTYRVTFATGSWFTQHKMPVFYPEIPVIFQADGTVPHYHIPLLISPYGFSTYRGN